MTNDILHKWLDAVDYRITGGDEALWDCWGPDARYIDALSKDGKNELSICIGGDRQVLAIYAYDITNNLAWRWFAKPEIAKAHADECVFRGVPDLAWEGVECTDLSALDDILEKTSAIFLGKDYDHRVVIDMDIDDDAFVHIAKEAHKRDITFNQMVELLLMKECSEIREN